jgi:uncharacterized membrane protein YqjE
LNETAAEETALGQGSPERGWRARLEGVCKAGGALLATRMAIFQEELAGKTRELAKAAVGFGLALAFALLALLVFTAFLASLLANLFGSAALGILAVFLLYAGVAAGAGLLGWKALSRVRIGDFPVTREELRKDWEAVRDARGVEEEGGTKGEDSDVESRFRAGSE